MLIPASKICLRSYQPKIFGPAIATCGLVIAAANNFASAYRSGAQSSCKIHNHSWVSVFFFIAGSFLTAAATAAPNPALSDPFNT